MPKLSLAGRTDVGLKRAKNEDSFVVRPDLQLCLVADGMGGAAAGELASRIFAETSVGTFSTSVNDAATDLAALVHKSFLQSNRRILEHVTRQPDHKGMGCTAEMLAFRGEDFVLGHIGDSRTYRFREGHLKQITKDHSLVQNMLEQGVITEEEARTHIHRNVILRAVGIEPKVNPDLIRGKAKSGDIFLLCSDGLTDMVDDGLIQEVLSSGISLAQKVEGFIELAKLGGGADNITAVLCQVG